MLEAKKLKAAARAAGSKVFDDAMLRARAQAEGYACALPASEGRPPFLIVVDVGHMIELYSEFSQSGATYVPFPDPRSHRIALADLAKPEIRERLKRVWADPFTLDPSRASARVTREVAGQLATLARSLEASGHAADHVAAFLTRCLFCMFAEDVELLPKSSFLKLLCKHRDKPQTLVQMLRILWQDMDHGGFCGALAGDVLRFNGKLFKGSNADGYVLPMTGAQIDQLIEAAKSNWREVEPAIFGTLLERALDPAERHALGAHYTPRAYVERLVLPTVIEPLRADWANAQAAAVLLAQEAAELAESSDKKGADNKSAEKKLQEARAEVRRFHEQLCKVRVLDPACGSGNFLYVTRPLQTKKRPICSRAAPSHGPAPCPIRSAPSPNCSPPPPPPRRCVLPTSNPPSKDVAGGSRACLGFWRRWRRWGVRAANRSRAKRICAGAQIDLPSKPLRAVFAARLCFVYLTYCVFCV